MNDSFNKESLDASEEEREMLDYLIEQERQSHLKSQQIYPRSSAQNPPLSFAQQRLWVLEQMVATGNAYNWCLAIRLRGMLSSEVVAKCLTEIVRRHEVLRTTIEVSNSEPYQVINPSSPVRMDTIEFLDLTEEEADSAIKDLVAEAGRDIFDLARGPLLKVRLLALGDRDHVLILSMHHIVSDGWSLGLLLDEFTSLYKAYRQHQTSPLPELSLQYADYSVWQRNWLVGEELERQLGYWRQQLQAAETLALPTDRVRPALATFNGKREVRQLDNDLKQSLTELAQREGVTLFILTLSVFVVLLHKYCAQDDIVVGSPVASRNRIETENLIGFFVNMLVFRTDTSGNPTFRDLLARVKHTGLAAFEHQDLPFERLVEALAKDRDMSRNPLFQVSFALQQKQPEAIDIEDGLSLNLVSAGNTTVRFDLELFVSERQQGLDIVAAYNTDLFDAETIERMLSHYQSLLEAMVTNPDMRIAELPMLGEQERQQVLVDWNQTKTEYPREQTVQALFEDQVSQNPDACAVEYDGDSLSYAELNERANQLAHYLRQLGVGAEVKVGLFVERGLDMVVALLGILKAGGAYVPLDLDYPSSRVAFMLEDAQVPVLLTTAKLTARLPELAGERVCLDTDWAQIAQQSANNPKITTSADSLAYVIYTSGSTGTPKGVEICHRAINRLVRNTDYYQADASDRIAQASSVSFDAATFEVWGALLNGAQLVGIDKNTLLNSNALAALLREKGVTAMFITTAVFNQIAREVPDAFQGLRAVMFGGEAVDCNAVRRVLANQPPQRLLHVYGPTESTTFAGWYPIESVAEDATTVPIGRPLANTTLYVLDADRRPVPVGVSGELYIGGDGLARGYLNRAELTAERFVPNPFEAGGKLYRTGDKVRYRADGAIEFQGRFDHQIKLRGFRIELGEIEAALIQLESVSDAVVVIREDGTGDKRLDAYVVPTSEWIEQNPGAVGGATDGPEAEEPLHQGLIAELRQQLRQQLPAYMMPSVYVLLDALPLNPNGKVDRKALPVPGDVRASLDAEYTAPRNAMEQQLAGIWAEVLKLERVGIHDNFFDLGGHSLMATQVVSRIRAQLHVELPLSEMFGYPTVAELAPLVETLLDDSDGEQVDVIPIADRNQPLPLSFAQERLWFLDQLESGGAVYNMPLAVRLCGELNILALESSINTIVRRHEPLRTTFFVIDGFPQQCIAGRLELTLKVEDFRDLPLQQRDMAIMERVQAEALQPFDLSRGPLIRVRLLGIKHDEHVMLFTLHHIVSDGWSIRILFDELAELYTANLTGQSATLADLAIQYADYSSWQRSRLQGDRLQRRQAYWQQQLTGLPVLELPTDYPRPPLQTFRGGREAWQITGSLLKELRRFCQQEDTTLYMAMLAIFSVLLQRYSGQSDIVVGSPIAGRYRHEIEGLIGFFLNNLVLRCDLSNDPPFKEVVRRVREVAVEAYEHQDLPFEKLVAELHPERDMSRNPLFQVMFNFMDLSETRLDLPGLQCEMVGQEIETTRFDLTLYAFEKADSLNLAFNYSRDLFAEETIREMKSHLYTLLEAAVNDPQCRISQLPLLGEAQRRRHEHSCNAVGPTEEGFGEIQAAAIEDTIQAMFARQVSACSEQMAVITRQHRWSYQQLDLESERVAQLIQRSAADDWERVALLFDHDAPLLASLIGVLKSGRAYVPLDPANPPGRLQRIVADAEVSAVVTETRWLELAQQLGAGLEVINSDEIVDITGTLDVPRTPDSLTYLLYTSGSTGEPKGVMQNDRNLLHHIRAYRNSLQLHAQDRLTLLSSYTFDAAVMDIFGALLTGATLYPVDVRNEGVQEIGAWINEQAITVLHSTPTVYRHILGQMNPGESLLTVRVMVMGGEPVFRNDVDLYNAHFSQECLFVNGLGPTESTTALQYWIDQDTVLARNAVPVGYPVQDTEVLLLNEFGEPTDILGEIAICSPYVALGYWRQAELTREKFGAGQSDSGIRIYRTGDLGRRAADGSIEFVGRKDQQLKLRGYRIEAGEVEAALCRHDSVERAAVMLYQDQNEEEKLVAYLVCGNGIVLDMEALRTYLKSNLPAYMIPAGIVELDDLPMTSGGKLDRRQLPDPEINLVTSAAYVAPTTETEHRLADIWQQVLSIDKVGIDNDFFSLGGHSLMVTQVVSRIHATLQVKMPLSTMFTKPNIAELALFIDEHMKESPEKGGLEQIERANIEINPSNLEALSDIQVAELLSELSAAEKNNYGKS